jgi:hypothetical protein
MTERKTVYTPAPKGRAVHAARGISTDAVYAALIEQLLAVNGPDAIARLLATRLRDPSPHRAILDMVARWLDPRGDDRFKLKVVRRRGGKSPTKSVNEIALVKAVAAYQRASGNKHGAQKKAVAEVADQFEVSKATVLKALRSK